MKQLISFLSLCLCAISAYAQFGATLGNSGTTFIFFVNNADMTCEIRDERQKIDDRKYAMSGYYRELLAFKKSKGTRTLTVPEKVTLNGQEYTITTIGRAVFAGFNNVDYIILPNTITRIGDYAFFRSSIQRIQLPPQVLEVGKRAFGHCYNLKEITTAMGGVHIPTEAYAESKGCQLTFKSSNEIPGSIPSGGESQPSLAKKRKSVKSDVDSNLPVSSGTNENLFAIIIANENYHKVAKVDYAEHDGIVFKQYCQTVLGIPEKHISYLTDATLLNMKYEVKHMKDVADAYDGQARFIFYYAGHGFPDEKGDEAFLLPVDGSGMNPDEGFSLSDLYQQFGNMPAQNITVFMDACFSGSQRGDGMLSSARGVAIRAKKKEPASNTVIFSAASNDETANPYHEQGHGLFTYFLLKKLKENPNVTLGELESYINSQVRKVSTVDIRKVQTPTTTAPAGMADNWKTMKLK